MADVYYGEMIVNEGLRIKRDNRINSVSAEKLKIVMDKLGYFPEAGIIPPFFEITIKASGTTSNQTSHPITHFVTKSSQQWRDFKIVRPENYTHTVDLIYKNYAGIQELLCRPQFLLSYANPGLFKTQAYRSGKQIANWAEVQRQLLTCSSQHRLPYLLEIDLQSCYHTLYTHCIEWAFESIGQKKLGAKLDESIRRGNDNRTHGLPVGQYTTEILSELVLSWVDTKLENALENINCMGFRFKDNYYILTSDLKDAQLSLAIIASELRNTHFTINDSKTTIGPFSEYYSTRWQSEYEFIVESLQLNTKNATFTDKRLKVFIEQVVNLSLKYKNQKSILEKAITVLVRCQFQGHIDCKWLFYAISNMLPLRSMSYPKLIAFLKMLTSENAPLMQSEFDNFFYNEVLFATDRKDVFALIWISYLLHDTKNTILKNLLLDNLAQLADQSPLIHEAMNYLKHVNSEPVLWPDNASRLSFTYKSYMTPAELHDYLGVSFGES